MYYCERWTREGFRQVRTGPFPNRHDAQEFQRAVKAELKRTGVKVSYYRFRIVKTEEGRG